MFVRLNHFILLHSIVFGLFLPLLSLQAHAELQSPEHFVVELFDELNDLYQDGTSVTTIEDDLLDLYHRHFDHQRISGFVLGQMRRRLNTTQMNAFADRFPAFLFRLLAPQLDRYFAENGGPRGTLNILNVKQLRRDTIVIAEFVGQQHLKTNVRLRKTDDQWKVLDIEFAGVSMLLTQRDIIAGLLSKYDFNIADFLAALESSEDA